MVVLPADHPIILLVDPAELARLERELDDPALVAVLYATYVSELRVRSQHIADAYAEGDHDEIIRAAHTLRSPSSTLGITTITKLCAAIESAARTEPASLDALVNELERLTSEVG